MKLIKTIAYVLVIIGALNWGLWGFFQFDLVAWLFDGNTSWLSRVIYSVVGLAGLWMLVCCKRCKCSCCCGSEKGGKSCK